MPIDKDLIAPISALVGALVGGGITTLKDVVLQGRKDKKALQYLSVMVLFALDKYVSEAAAVVCDDGQEDMEGFTEATTTSPTFRPEELKVEWTTLSPTLVHSIFDLAARTAYARGAIDHAGEYADPPDYEEFFDERQMQFSELGLAAADIAEELRTLSCRPGRLQTTEWDPVLEMKARRAKLVSRREARAKRQEFDLAAISDGS